MNKKLFFVILFFGTYFVNAQYEFEKGYYINTSGEKIECLIKDKQWQKNPEFIEIKLKEGSDEQILNKAQISEFSIIGNSKYIKRVVTVDHSSQDINNLSNEMKPIYKKETILMNVVVEGKANLYNLKNNEDAYRFYMEMEDSKNIEPLVYKKYFSENKVATNTIYRKQLFDKLKCDAITLSSLRKTKYNLKDLSKIFVAYNNFKGEQIIDYSNRKRKNVFDIYVHLGANYSSLAFVSDFNNNDAKSEIDSKISPKIGFEVEYLITADNNWALFSGVNYNSFKSSGALFFNNNDYTAKANYSYLEIPIGLRRYFVINSKNKLYINAAYGIVLAKNKQIYAVRDYTTLDLSIGASNIMAGIGYNINRKLNIELRAGFTRNIVKDYVFRYSIGVGGGDPEGGRRVGKKGGIAKYNSVSLNFGYKLF